MVPWGDMKFAQLVSFLPSQMKYIYDQISLVIPVWKGWQRRAEDFFHSSDRRTHKSSYYIMVEKNAHNMIMQFTHILYCNFITPR